MSMYGCVCELEMWLVLCVSTAHVLPACIITTASILMILSCNLGVSS